MPDMHGKAVGGILASVCMEREGRARIAVVLSESSMGERGVSVIEIWG